MNWKTRKKTEAEYVRLTGRLVRHFFNFTGTVAEALESFRTKAASPLFRKWAETAAGRMITGVYEENARTWREAAREGMRGREVAKLLSNELRGNVGNRARELVRQNADLISSLPAKAAADVTRLVAEGAARGERSEEIMNSKFIVRRVAHLTASRIRLIGRTETSKAQTALTRSRAEDLGVDFYVWRSSEDQRVRSTHRHMHNVIVPWGDAPSPEALRGEKSKLGKYHAGDAPNCRCYPEPLLRLDQVQWPHKVYRNGAVRSMTRASFVKEFRQAA